MKTEDVERYARHLVLKEIGGPGQARLKKAKVLIIGAGGLGAPASLYLAAAGIETIGIMDDDTVALSNLQRQVLFSAAEIGTPKTSAAALALGRLNPYVQINAHQCRFGPDTAALIKGYDLVLDGTDNFETRFAINAACHAAAIPLIVGAAIRFDGQVACFDSHQGKTACYRCLVPSLPEETQTCENTGVVGALTGVIGSMMALEAIKIITQAGTPLFGRLMIYDGLSGQARTLRLPPDPACPVCGD